MRTPWLIGAALVGVAAGAPASRAEEGPPPARPGQCFARVVEAPRTRVVREQVLVRPARTEARSIAARTHWETRPVLLEPERRETVRIPPVLREVSEPELVRPASVRVEVIPAEWRDVPQTVMVSPPRRYWRRSTLTPGYGPGWAGPSQLTPTGEVVCLVEEPARYQTVWRRVCVRPERRVEMPVPAETRWVTRTVVVQPERLESRVSPARWGERQVEVVDAPERVETVAIPPEYREVEREVVDRPGATRWVPAPCAAPPPPPCPCAASPGPRPPPVDRLGDDDAPPAPPLPPPGYAATPMDEDVGASGDTRVRPRPVRPLRRRAAATIRNPVADMQRALRARGYYRGPIDGLFTPAAGDALHRFQRDQRLPEGALTRESAQRLGVDP